VYKKLALLSAFVPTVLEAMAAVSGAINSVRLKTPSRVLG